MVDIVSSATGREHSGPVCLEHVVEGQPGVDSGELAPVPRVEDQGVGGELGSGRRLVLLLRGGRGEGEGEGEGEGDGGQEGEDGGCGGLETRHSSGGVCWTG